MRTDYLDCCEQPTLEVIRPLYQASHDAEALMRCTHCQTPWFYRFSEYVTFDGPDDMTSWFTRLDGEEAERIRTVDDTAMDLGFLEQRQSWMHDGEGPTAGVWAAASSLELTGAILPVSIQWSARLARGQAATA